MALTQLRRQLVTHSGRSFRIAVVRAMPKSMIEDRTSSARRIRDMGTWRLLGTLRQGRNADEIRAASLGGWNPWQYQWSRLDAPAIVVPNAAKPCGHGMCHCI